MGLDLAAYLSAELDIPFIAYCKDLCLEYGTPIATSRLFGGKMFVEIAIEHEQAILSVLPGAFHAVPGLTTSTPQVEHFKPTALSKELRTHFECFIEPEKTDLDITAVPILVSLGRGIKAKENVEMAQELADELGGALAASRPVVDQGWLPMSRQVGRSGVIVKPRLYLALGISGAPEHTEGMRSAELIIAINKDPQAPIFEIAHYGVYGDVLNLVPALTDAMKCRKLAA
jgi:electron transfer flavoprotein alpha subunit